MEEHRHLPDANRFSVLTATILLAYALTPFIKLPESSFTLQLPGIIFPFRFTFSSLISIIVALLAAVGTDWLLRGHPHLGKQKTFQHSLLPAMTAWVIGLPLSALIIGTAWWVVFTLGGVLLALVFYAEYIVVDFSDMRHAPATVGLTAVSFSLFLILSIAVYSTALRLYLLLPALVIPMVLVSLRALYLRLGGRWCISWSIGISLVVGQIAMALHYWPLSPLAYGLLLLGPAYALTGIAGSIEEKRPWATLWIEPVIMLVIFWGLAIILGK
jgi:hypothetical protein